MATLISNNTVTALMSGAATFAAVEAGSGAEKGMRNTVSLLIAAATTVNSETFTVTNAKVIDGVLLYLKNDGNTPTGTFKVALQLSGVDQASVTVNKADLPVNQNSTAAALPGAVFFKFTGTATGDGSANWRIQITTTGTGQIYYAAWQNVANNFTRHLRTTTAATPAAGNDLFVVGELTGAGTKNTITVAMDSVATTIYGSGVVNSTTVYGGHVTVGAWGTLAYGNTSGPQAATNYYLKVAGDVRVTSLGTLSIGSSGAEIPRNSTAVLEFSLGGLANGDFGLIVQDNATFNSFGLSRTAAKTVNKCKLTADATSTTTITSINSSGMTQVATTHDNESTGTSFLGGSAQENTSNSTHHILAAGPTLANTTQTAAVWLAQGTGAANNRYVRVVVGNSSILASVTNGFFADVDLQAGTIGTCTAIGTGTATSSTITAVGAGYVVTITGKVQAASTATSLHLAACSASGTTSYLGASNFNFVYSHIALYTASSFTNPSFSVDADTGWLSGDVVALASTSRTQTDVELLTLSAAAGASSFTSAQPMSPLDWTVNPIAITHNGTSPFQGEVALITRNVRIRSTSPTLCAYGYFCGPATVTVQWTEFKNMGKDTFTTTKRAALEIDSVTTGTAGAKSITYCSIHDGLGYSILMSISVGTASTNLTVQNNIFWNGTAPFFATISTMTVNDWTLDNNLAIKIANYAFSFSELQGTITNNTANAVTSFYGFLLQGATIGTFSGNTAHCCAGGMNLSGGSLSGTITNQTCWRCSSSSTALVFNTIAYDITFVNYVGFGNLGAQAQIGGGVTRFVGGSMSGDTSFSSTTGITDNSSDILILDVDSVDFSGTGTGLAPPTASDISINTSATPMVNFKNCKVGTLAHVKANWTKNSYMGFEKYNQTAGDHRMELKTGTLKTDTVIFNTATPSMRMTPNSASSKLAMTPGNFAQNGVLVPVASGTTVDVSVYIRKSAAGDGAAYNGAQPRMIQRANSALGQDNDVVLATYSSSTGSWNQITGTTSSAGDDGVWEIIIDCDGTTGWVNVDDWSFVRATTTGNAMKNWYCGSPVVNGGAAPPAVRFSAGFSG